MWNVCCFICVRKVFSVVGMLCLFVLLVRVLLVIGMVRLFIGLIFMVFGGVWCGVVGLIFVFNVVGLYVLMGNCMMWKLCCLGREGL